MLIPFKEIVQILAKLGLPPIRGILHVGAHDCEERNDYNAEGISDDQIYWVEGMKHKVEMMKGRGIPHIYHALVAEAERDVEFNITNNGQSSSLLEFGTHEASYPWCKVVETITVRTKRLDSLITEKSIPMERRNFWNLDIQGAELSALRSAGDNINFADAIYAEVNTQEVYKGCGQLPELDAFLESKGFKREMIKMTDAGWGDALYVRMKSA